jgi:hypothetical protein
MKRIFALGFLLALFAIACEAQTATFVKADTTTHGTWASYGIDGYSIPQETTSLPSYATVTGNSPYLYTWAANTTDPRGLTVSPTSTLRAATCWFGSGWNTNISITDGATHELAIYLVDWDSGSRAETVQILNTATSAVLNTQSVTSFVGGEYLVWNVSGNVTIRIIQVAGPNAVMSGIFFAPVAGTTPPPVVVPPVCPVIQHAASFWWNPVSGATNYAVYRSTTPAGIQVQLTQTTALVYTDTTVAAGQTYYYTIASFIGTTQTLGTQHAITIPSP